MESNSNQQQQQQSSAAALSASQQIMPRHMMIPATKASKHGSSSSQLQASLHLQHMMQMQQNSGNGAQKGSALSKGSKPSIYESKSNQSSLSNSNANTIATQQQQHRALTQLYHQTLQTPLAHQNSKLTQHSAKNLLTASNQKQSTKSHHHQTGSSHSHSKKDNSATKQVNLQAKFASLLKMSKDKDSSSKASMPTSGKEKKGDRKNDMAAVARNQLFGASQQKGSGATTKLTSKELRAQQQQLSPPRSVQNMRQTPNSQQQMLIVQSGSPQTIKSQTAHKNQHQSSNQQQQNTGSPNSHQRVAFPRQASQNIPNFVSDGIMRILSDQPQAILQQRENRTSQQFSSVPRQASNSQTRKKKTRSSNATGFSRTNVNPTYQTEAVNSMNNIAQVHQAPSHHRSSHVGASSKQKKKKQQPSQQQINTDPADDYLSNIARAQNPLQQNSIISGAVLPLQSQTPSNASSGLLQQELTRPAPHYVNQLETPSVESQQQQQPLAQNSQLSQNLNSHSMQTLIQATPPQTQQNANSSAAVPMLEALESQLMTQFKTKCQQEMQIQTKQAIAKLLYTKREVMMEIKALQSTVKAFQQQNPPRSVAQSPHADAQMKEQNTQTLTTYLAEQATRDLIKQHMAKAQAFSKADQKELNEHIELRIDDILIQIQNIVSGLEDSVYSKLSVVEKDVYDLNQKFDELKSEEENQKKILNTATNQLSIQAAESLKQLKHQMQTQFTQYETKETLNSELDEIKRRIESIVNKPKKPKVIEKTMNDYPLSVQHLAQIDEKILQLQQSMHNEGEQKRQKIFQQQEDRLNGFQKEVTRLVTNTVQMAQRDFESVATGVRDDVQHFITKEFMAKEATIENKMENSKQQFLKAINGNMRILDNLINEYTTRTHDQIKKQLLSAGTGPSSRTMHNSNQGQEEIQSIPSSDISGKSDRFRRGSNNHQINNLGDITGKSVQIQGSLSSVQDVSESKQQTPGPDNDEISSQLLSTRRDKELQAEASAFDNVRFNGIQKRNSQKEIPSNYVPQLNIRNMIPVFKQSSNSERLQMPQPAFMPNQQERRESNHTNLSYNPNQNFNSPPKDSTIYSSFQHAPRQNDSKLLSNEKVIVEEQKFTQSQEESQKFTQSQEESSSQSNNDHMMNIRNNSANHVTPINFYERDMPQYPQSQEVLRENVRRQSPPKQNQTEAGANSPVDAISQNSKGPDCTGLLFVANTSNPIDSLIQPIQINSGVEELNARHQDEMYRYELEGDLQEQSIDIMDHLVGAQNTPQTSGKNLRKCATDALMSNNSREQPVGATLGSIYGQADPRLRSAILKQKSVSEQRKDEGIKEEQKSKLNQDEQLEQIDFALSVISPSVINQNGIPVANSVESNSNLGEAAFNFQAYNQMQRNFNPGRSQTVKYPPKFGEQQRAQISTRLIDVSSPIMVQCANNNMQPTVNGSTNQKFENTDSDFFNLTAEDDSQSIDPILVMRTISNTQLCSGSSSVIQIQESCSGDMLQVQQHKGKRQSFQSYQMKQDESEQVQVHSYQLLEIDNNNSRSNLNNNPAILTDEPASDVQMIENINGQRLNTDQHIKEFSPATTTNQEDEQNDKSFTNTDYDDEEQDQNPRSSSDQMANFIAGYKEDDKEAAPIAVVGNALSGLEFKVVHRENMLTLNSEEDEEQHNQLVLQAQQLHMMVSENHQHQQACIVDDDITIEEQVDIDEEFKLDEDTSNWHQNLVISSESTNNMTKEQARRSSMIPMEEKQTTSAQPANSLKSALFDTNDNKGTALVQESSSYSSKGGEKSNNGAAAIANQLYTRGKKPGSDLPPNLQRKGNEIIHELLLDEVISALEEVIHLSRDKLNDIILDQQTAITTSNRNLINNARTQRRRVATHGDDGVMHDNSDRYELSGSDSKLSEELQQNEDEHNLLGSITQLVQASQGQVTISTLDQRQEQLNLNLAAQMNSDSQGSSSPQQQ